MEGRGGFSTRREDRAVVNLDDSFLEQLSRFFGHSCKDERYIKPTLIELPVSATTPQLSTWQEANLNSICEDFKVISVTQVIAQAFERAVNIFNETGKNQD